MPKRLALALALACGALGATPSTGGESLCVTGEAHVAGVLHAYAVAGDGGCLVLVDGELVRLGRDGGEVWRAEAPWPGRPDPPGGGFVATMSRDVEALPGGESLTVDSDGRRLVLRLRDRDGRALAEAAPPAPHVRGRSGIADLATSGEVLILGYSVDVEGRFRSREYRGLVAYDRSLRELWRKRLAGDNLTVAADGSIYVAGGDGGRDPRWVRVSPAGEVRPLPRLVSRDTCVVQAGMGDEVVLWRHLRDSEGRSLRAPGPGDGGDLPGGDYAGSREVWRPGEVAPSQVYVGETSRIGGVVALAGGRYAVVLMPLEGNWSVACVDRAGEGRWRHEVAMADRFSWPSPTGDGRGGVLLLESERPEGGGGPRLVLARLSAEGNRTREAEIEGAPSRGPWNLMRGDGGGVVVQDAGPRGHRFVFLGAAE